MTQIGVIDGTANSETYNFNQFSFYEPTRVQQLYFVNGNGGNDTFNVDYADVDGGFFNAFVITAGVGDDQATFNGTFSYFLSGAGNDTLTVGPDDTSAVFDGNVGTDKIILPGTIRDYSFEADFNGSSPSGAIGAYSEIVSNGNEDGPFISAITTNVELFQFDNLLVNQDDGYRLVDDLYYYGTNPDVADSGLDAETHYFLYGADEGRDPNALFDTSAYLDQYTDVAAAGVNPLEHYRQFGWREGRDPSANFDTSLYLQANPDVAAAGINPLDHYLTYGVVEGRAIYPSEVIAPEQPPVENGVLVA